MLRMSRRRNYLILITKYFTRERAIDGINEDHINIDYVVRSVSTLLPPPPCDQFIDLYSY